MSDITRQSTISYVQTDSMEPTLSPGDGFVGIPAPIAGEISEGDVVTFDAQVVGGGLTTHRIQAVTDDGYITKGDGNPFTDQSAGEPVVQESQIEMVALQFNGNLVVIPGIGIVTAALQNGFSTIAEILGAGGAGVSGVAIGVAGLVLVLLTMGYDVIRSDTSRIPTRSPSRRDGVVDSKLILLAILIALSLPLMSMMTIPSGTEEAVIVSVGAPNEDDPSRIEAGSFSESSYTMENNQFLPKVVILGGVTDGVSFGEDVHAISHGGVAETTLRLEAPESTGRHIHVRSEHHYIHVLPTSVIAALHNIHPLVAMLTITGVMLSPIVVLFYFLVGFRPIALREATRNV